MPTTNSITFLDAETGDVLKRVELERAANLGSVFTSHRTSHILDELAEQVSLDADWHRIPEHRQHLDQPGPLLGYGIGETRTTKLTDHVFEVRGTLRLIAGKRTETGCTYVDTDTREFTVVNVKNYAA